MATGESMFQPCLPKTPRTALALAGSTLTRTVATPSMHTSCLRPYKALPKMASIEALKLALEKDATTQQQKYRGSEPSGIAARFNVELPTSPQNMKFSSRPQTEQNSANTSRFLPGISGEDDDDEGFGDEQEEGMGLGPMSLYTLESNMLLGVAEGMLEDIIEGEVPSPHSSHRFNMTTLRKWFKDIDVKKSGSISQRELIVALRQHRVLQALFCSVQGVEMIDSSHTGVDGAAHARREEVQRIKRILDEIDIDGSGTMEWGEFVEFFRRAGLLLEYLTNDALNRPHSAEGEAIFQDHEAHEALDPAARRASRRASRRESRLADKPGQHLADQQTLAQSLTSLQQGRLTSEKDDRRQSNLMSLMKASFIIPTSPAAQ